MITWAAPKFCSQASQFVPVPPQEPHTKFRFALLASPIGLATQLTDSEYAECELRSGVQVNVSCYMIILAFDIAPPPVENSFPRACVLSDHMLMKSVTISLYVTPFRPLHCTALLRASHGHDGPSPAQYPAVTAVKTDQPRSKATLAMVVHVCSEMPGEFSGLRLRFPRCCRGQGAVSRLGPRNAEHRYSAVFLQVCIAQGKRIHKVALAILIYLLSCGPRCPYTFFLNF